MTTSYPSPVSSPSSSVSSISDFEDEQLYEVKFNPSEGSLSPHVIKIINMKPLELAKKHPTQSKRPQGRPFNDSLHARFLFFTTVDDLITALLNHKDQDTVRLIDNNNAINQELNTMHNNRQIVQYIKQNSLNMNIKSPSNIQFNLKPIQFSNFNNNIHVELCKIFDILDFSFIKIIRNNKGKLIKFEILSNVKNHKININYIKKFITYPRYKSNMKIYLINGKFDKNVWFYNDLRMLLWDIEHSDISNKRILVNNLILQ